MAQWWIHIDLAGIQRYVYSSRTLLDGIGRAAQVEDATDAALLDREHVLPVGIRVEFAAAGALILSTPSRADDDPARPPERVRSAVGAYTRWLYDRSGALTPVVAIQFVPDGGAAAAHLAAPDLLRHARHRMSPGVAGAVPPGVLRCSWTSAPATRFERGKRIPIAEDADRARERGRQWHDSQQGALLGAAPLPTGHTFALPTLIDQLGRTETVSSHVAVMVLDINDLGDALRSLEAGELSTRAEVAEQLRVLSGELAGALVHRVASAVEDRDGTFSLAGTPVALEFPLHTSSPGEADIDSSDASSGRGVPAPRLDGEVTEWLLPIRPWVIAGDDLVLVCESRVAWDLATAAMDWLSAPADDGARAALRGYGPSFGTGTHLTLTLGIGIAVVPVGYSLAAAHELASGLCKNAKRERRENDWPGHVVDWHRAPTTLPEVLADRARSGPRSCGRPYHHIPAHLETPGAYWKERDKPTWDDLMHLLDTDRADSLRSHHPRGDTHSWADRHGWVKTELLAAVRSSDDHAVAGVLAEKNAREQALTGTGMAELAAGVDARYRRGLIVDAIDLLDDHLQLRTVERSVS